MSIEKIKELQKIPSVLRLDWDLKKKARGFEVSIGYDQEKYPILHELPREQMPIPEQLLLNFLLNQERKENKIFVPKDNGFRLFYYLHDIDHEKYPEHGLETGGDLELNYRLELVGSNSKLHVDLKDHAYTSLREIPREDLVLEEKMFLTLLANTPCNNGYFYFNQRNLPKMYYFLKNIKNVFDFKTGTRIKIAQEDFAIDLKMKKKGAGYLLELHFGSQKIDFHKLKVLGDKEYCLQYKEVIYNLPLFRFYLLSIFNKGEDILIPKERLPEFITDFKTLFEMNNIKCQLPDLVVNIESNIIEVESKPELLVEEKGDSLKIKYILNYENYAKVEYDPDLENDFYIIKNKKNKLYLKRDKLSEDWLNDYLLEHRFVREGNGYLISQDDFIDFFTYQYDGLRKNIGLTVSGHDLKKYRFDDDLNFDIDLDFREVTGIDWFEFSPKYKAGNDVLTHEELRSLVESKKNYIRLKDGKLAKVPIAEYEKLENYIEIGEYDKKKQKYLLKKQELFFVYSAVRRELKTSVDKSLKELLANLSEFKGIKKIPLPAKINGKPRDYQKEGYYWLNFLCENNFHGILADDMGLGKTFQILLLLNYLKEKKKSNFPSLVVAPTSVVFNWVAEVEKFTPNLKTLVLTGSKERMKKTSKIEDYDIVITSYALIRNDLHHYQKYNFNYLILDEAQYIKNPKAQVTQAVKCVRSKYRLALTGTPIENRLTELWSIFDYLMPGFLGSYSYFRTVFENDVEKLQQKVKPFIMRRMKVDVLDDLPPKNEILSYSELVPEQEKAYLAVLDLQRRELLDTVQEKGIGRSQINILSALLKLRQVSCHPSLLNKEADNLGSGKFDQLKELLSEIIEDGHKVIVFSQFVEMLKIIRKHLDKESIFYSYLDGSTRNRQKEIEEFNNTPDIPVFLCSLKAGGFGLNLTSANYVIIYDPWWNPAVEQQAMDRVYRIGQTKKVFVYKLISKGTVEEKILKLQDKKQKLVDNILSKEPVFAKDITQEDLEDLFSY